MAADPSCHQSHAWFSLSERSAKHHQSRSSSSSLRSVGGTASPPDLRTHWIRSSGPQTPHEASDLLVKDVRSVLIKGGAASTHPADFEFGTDKSRLGRLRLGDHKSVLRELADSRSQTQTDPQRRSIRGRQPSCGNRTFLHDGGNNTAATSLSSSSSIPMRRYRRTQPQPQLSGDVHCAGTLWRAIRGRAWFF